MRPNASATRARAGRPWEANHRRRDERGSVSLELAIIAPAVLLLLGALVLAGRVETSSATVEQAARAIEKAYIDGQFLRRPQVAITVERAGTEMTFAVRRARVVW